MGFETPDIQQKPDNEEQRSDISEESAGSREGRGQRKTGIGIALTAAAGMFVGGGEQSDAAYERSRGRVSETGNVQQVERPSAARQVEPSEVLDDQGRRGADKTHPEKGAHKNETDERVDKEKPEDGRNENHASPDQMENTNGPSDQASTLHESDARAETSETRDTKEQQEASEPSKEEQQQAAQIMEKTMTNAKATLKELPEYSLNPFSDADTQKSVITELKNKVPDIKEYLADGGTKPPEMGDTLQRIIDTYMDGLERIENVHPDLREHYKEAVFLLLDYFKQHSLSELANADEDDFKQWAQSRRE